MTNDRLEALLWARIDNTIDPQELAELEARLAEHPEPREIEHQISTIAEVLERFEVIEPPPALRGRIDGELSQATPPVARAAVAPRTVSTGSWPARWLPLAASLLVGVAIGYLLHPATFPKIDPAVVAGALLPTTTAQVGEMAVIDLGEEYGKVSVASSTDAITMELTVTAETGLALVLEVESGEVNIRRLVQIEGSPSRLWVNGPRIAIHADAPGRHTLSISASEPLSPITLIVFSGNQMLAERRIEAAARGAVQ